MEENVFQSGAVIDTRPDSERLKDFKVEELVSAFAPVVWKEKPPTEWRKFPIFNQDGSGSCVAQTEAKELGIMRWLRDGNYVHFSATDIYQRRANKPQAGMNAVDARKIAAAGVTLESLVPSQNMSDSQMDGATIESYKREVGAVFKVPNFVELPFKDIDAVASYIQTTGKGVMVWFYFLPDEWTEKPYIKYPDLDLYAMSTARHSVTAVDFALINGEKCLIIEDSWGTSFGMAGQRVITETFFKKRNWYAGYLMNFRFAGEIPPTPTKPKYTFEVILSFGQTSNVVKSLQEVLKYEGLFPLNVESTGYYGAVTAKGVLAFQKRYAVAPVAELDLLQGRRVGEKTYKKLIEIYGQ